jgi:hypothetical protein
MIWHKGFFKHWFFLLLRRYLLILILLLKNKFFLYYRPKRFFYRVWKQKKKLSWEKRKFFFKRFSNLWYNFLKNIYFFSLKSRISLNFSFKLYSVSFINFCLESGFFIFLFKNLRKSYRFFGVGGKRYFKLFNFLWPR